MRAPDLSQPQILVYADEFYKRLGRWPRRDDGRISGGLGLTWCAIDQALRKGNRGLKGNSSLSQFLLKHRSVRHRNLLPKLTESQILRWADAYLVRIGAWPTSTSGPIPEAPGETWLAVDHALRRSRRGFTKVSSLARLLADRRGYRNSQDLLRLTIRQILTWADAHYRRTDRWPTRNSGPIDGAPGETWARVSNALSQGQRSLSGGSSLAQLLAKHRRVPNRKALPKLHIKDIVRWADEHSQRTGRWPTHISGPIVGAPGETWGAVEAILRRGGRGLPGASSLFRVLHKYRKIPIRRPRRAE